MTTTSTSTALDRVMAAGRIVLKKGSWTLKEVAEAVVDPLPDLTGYTETIPFPPAPKPVVLTDEVKASLGALPGVFGQINMTERRALTNEEILAVKSEQDIVREVLAALNGRDEAIKEMVRHTMDVRAEEAGVAVPKAVKAGNGTVIVAATPRDKEGHYILSAKSKPERLPIPQTNMEYSREFRAGSLTIAGSDLDTLHKDGKVSREDYLAFTVEKRVFDEDKAKKAITDKPERMSILRLISSRSGAGTSLFVRKAQ
jgi:hypothetical protein